MISTPRVLLDACVLANFSLCDTLLRLAQPPGLYEPKWSEEIMRETTRTLEVKLGWPTAERCERVRTSTSGAYDPIVFGVFSDPDPRNHITG